MKRELFERLLAARQAKRPAVVFTLLQLGEQALYCAGDPEPHQTRREPRKSFVVWVRHLPCGQLPPMMRATLPETVLVLTAADLRAA